jgi:hypothetical protein
MRDTFELSDYGLVDVGICMPGDRRDIVDYARDEGVDEGRIQRLLDNKVRWFHMDEDLSDVEMVSAAIEHLCVRLQDRAWLRRVTHVIYAHTQAFSMPCPPVSLLSELSGRYEDLRPAMAFSVEHAACASAVMSLEWASLLLHDGGVPDALALVVTSDRVFGNATWRIRQDAGVQSDGASALLVGAYDLRCRFGGITVSTYDKLHEGPSSPENEMLIARTTWLHTRQMFREHSRATGLDLSHASAILPINADLMYWMKIARALRIDPELFYLDGITNRGHACCADLAVNLVDRGLALVQAGGWVVFCGQSNLGAYAGLTLTPPEGAPVPRAVPSRAMAECA